MDKPNYCYLVNHPTKGRKVFYVDADYYRNECARLAIDYADSLVPITKVILVSSEEDLALDTLSAQFSAVTKTTEVELPQIPVEALLSSIG